MLRLYKGEWQLFKKDYSSAFLTVFAVSVLVAIMTYFSLVSQPALAEEAMKKLTEQFKAKGFHEDMTQHDLFRLILANNLLISVLMVVLGLIPVVFLPAISAVGTFASVGILLAYSKIKGQNIAHLILFGLLPHGLIEVTSMLFTSAVGVYLSLSIFRKIFSRHRSLISVRGALRQAGRSFLLVSVPMIIIAALIEGYVTPLLMSLVMAR